MEPGSVHTNIGIATNSVTRKKIDNTSKREMKTNNGDDEQIVPIGASGLRSSKLVRNAILKIYKGAPHGLPETHKEQLNADLLAFFES